MTGSAATSEGSRAGFCALIGRPNAGKSTLLNAILGQKLAIVSALPQTTRNRILGVKTVEGTQIVFVDTPGIHKRRDPLGRYLVKEAFAALDGVDAVVLVTEVGGPRGVALAPEDAALLAEVRERAGEVPIVVAINKIDRVRERRMLLPLIDAWRARGLERIVPISALVGDGVPALLGEVAALMPPGPHLYPEDMLTDRAERFLVAELIREQVFHHTRQEVPYSVAVEVETFRERPERGDVWIEAVIHVDRPTQKGILIGEKGAMIKRIGSAARAEITRLLGCPAHLKLRVHVEPHWTRSPAARRRFGYE